MTINNAGLKFGSMTKRKKTTVIVLHHAAGNGSVGQIHDYHRNEKGWSGIGYHFYVRKDGSVWQGRPTDTVGAHTVNYNSVSIGVCFEGNFENEEMPTEQRRAGAELVRYIRGQYPSIERVVRHGDLRATSCPGRRFPFNEIVGEFTESESEQRATEKENRVKQFQLAAIADGFKFPKFGADGMWGSECAAVAGAAICKKRVTYKYRNLTKLVQRAVGVTADGMFGNATRAAVISFQRMNGLTADGAWGVKCWKHWAGVK